MAMVGLNRTAALEYRTAWEFCILALLSPGIQLVQGGKWDIVGVPATCPHTCMPGPVTQLVVENEVLFYQWAGEDQAGSSVLCLVYMAHI